MDDAAPPIAPLTPEQDDFARALARAVLYIPRSFTADLGRDLGMTSTEFFTLAHLSDAPGGRARMGDLALATALSLSATTRVVGQLARAGYVTKVRAADDGRGWEAHLTQAGRDQLARAYPHRVASLRHRVFDRLQGVDLEPLTRALDRIVADD
ncbi:MarR family winged helix-turn-helix transcriptional regulator [Demequina capsici]|uniref:MarR family transcriptional regulator n=1 Tax=Demequina capsici TaxID=3075620 RepID=A0AA96F6K2_9MICO|nr:MarR family transcriptional regulator [Demequina sp. OYTSA14]WNM24996.1 MarR family transcriptional regulator [Demequina sp. OYTSA14]